VARSKPDAAEEHDSRDAEEDRLAQVGAASIRRPG
jgi:hypothetical protein